MLGPDDRISLSGGEIATNFWRDYLRDSSLPTPLGLDRQRKDTASGTRRTLALSITANTAAVLDGLCDHFNVPADAIWRAVWTILRCRYSGSAEAVFGIPGHADSPDLLPLRIQLDDDATAATTISTVVQNVGNIASFRDSTSSEVAVAAGFPAAAG